MQKKNDKLFRNQEAQTDIANNNDDQKRQLLIDQEAHTDGSNISGKNDVQKRQLSETMGPRQMNARCQT